MLLSSRLKRSQATPLVIATLRLFPFQAPLEPHTAFSGDQELLSSPFHVVRSSKLDSLVHDHGAEDEYVEVDTLPSPNDLSSHSSLYYFSFQAVGLSSSFDQPKSFAKGARTAQSFSRFLFLFLCFGSFARLFFRNTVNLSFCWLP